MIHVEGKISQPERFFLYDFTGTSDSLLVLLNGREAIENYEYTFSPENCTLTFRSDLSNKKLSKEIGFPIQLPKGDSTFIVEKMEEGEKVFSVMRYYDTLAVYEWQQGETFYQMTVEEEKTEVAEKWLRGV